MKPICLRDTIVKGHCQWLRGQIVIECNNSLLVRLHKTARSKKKMRKEFCLSKMDVWWFSFQFVSIYAAYLYDSVKLYAWALDKLLQQEQRPLTDKVVYDVASNGTRIIETIIKNRTYDSKYSQDFSIAGCFRIEFKSILYKYHKLQAWRVHGSKLIVMVTLKVTFPFWR